MWKHWSFQFIHDGHFSHFFVKMENKLLWVSVQASVFFSVTKILPDYPCKSDGPDHQWADLVIALLLYDKRKCEHKVVRLVWKFDFCFILIDQYMPMNSHCISYKQTWYPPDIMQWWETFTKAVFFNKINHGKSDV